MFCCNMEKYISRRLTIETYIRGFDFFIPDVLPRAAMVLKLKTLILDVLLLEHLYRCC
jgi:hypothetical protein